MGALSGPNHSSSEFAASSSSSASTLCVTSAGAFFAFFALFAAWDAAVLALAVDAEGAGSAAEAAGAGAVTASVTAAGGGAGAATATGAAALLGAVAVAAASFSLPLPSSAPTPLPPAAKNAMRFARRSRRLRLFDKVDEGAAAGAADVSALSAAVGSLEATSSGEPAPGADEAAGAGAGAGAGEAAGDAALAEAGALSAVAVDAFAGFAGFPDCAAAALLLFTASTKLTPVGSDRRWSRPHVSTSRVYVNASTSKSVRDSSRKSPVFLAKADTATRNGVSRPIKGGSRMSGDRERELVARCTA
jgi:hypothetical protein